MSKRILVAALCLLNLWVGFLYLWPMRTRPVWDLPQFYFAGKLVRAGQISDLYHKPAYEPLVSELRKVDARAARYCTYFNRPAFEAPLFLPLAWLSYRAASILAVAVNFALLGFLVWKLPQWFPSSAMSGIWLFVFMPFLHTVAFAQDTLLLTLILAFGLHLWYRGRDVPAGVVLALSAFKPHLIWAVTLALAAGKKWKTLYAFAATGTLLALFSFILVGPRGVQDWIGLLQEPGTDLVPPLMLNVRALGLYWGAPVAFLAALVAAISFGAVLKTGPFVEKVGAALLVGLLLSPHTYLQDYSLIAIVAMTSPYAAWRYLFLVPWPYFWPAGNFVPFIVLALAYLVTLAAQPLLHSVWCPRPPLDVRMTAPVASAHVAETGHMGGGSTPFPQ